MVDLVKQLKKLINKCPDIELSNQDIKDLIEKEGDTNFLYTKNKGIEITISEEIVEAVKEAEIIANEEITEHIQECDDEGCECKSVFDDIEE